MNGDPWNSNPCTVSIGLGFGIQLDFGLRTGDCLARNSSSGSMMFTATASPGPSTSERGCSTFSQRSNACAPHIRRRENSMSLSITCHITRTGISWITSLQRGLSPSGRQPMHLGSTSLNLTSERSKNMHSTVPMTRTITQGGFAFTATSDSVTERLELTNADSLKCSIINLEWH